MKVLIADCPPELRDQIHVGLDAFATFQIHEAEGLKALELIRRYQYDLIFLYVGSGKQSKERLIDRMEGRDGETPIIVVAKPPIIEDLKGQKVRARVFTFLEDPLAPVELFRSVQRFQQRKEVREVRSTL